MHAQLLFIGLISFAFVANCCGAASGVLPAPITNATDATRRSVLLANHAIAERTARRFTEQSATATRAGDRWIWRGRIGYGQGDLEVVVMLRADGTAADTKVSELTSIPSQRPLRREQP
jgi:hypothetical protein